MDVLVQQEGVCATDAGATPTAAMNLKPYDQFSNNHQLFEMVSWDGQFGASLAVFLGLMVHDSVGQVKRGLWLEAEYN